MNDGAAGVIHIAGGGRWARVLAGLAAGLRPYAAIRLHSPHAAADLEAWRARQDFGARLWIGAAQLDPSRQPPGPLLVANRAADHRATALAALAAGWPVLVEKPLAPTAQDVAALLAAAAAGPGRLAASQVFLFHPAVAAAAQAVRDAGAPPASAALRWEDPAGEQRHGAAKRYDPAVPVLLDVMPHALAILRGILVGEPRLVEASFARGGRCMTLALQAGPTRCALSFERDGTARHRSLVLPDLGIELDFAADPGRVTRQGEALPLAPLPAGQGPLAAQLTAFLAWAEGGAFDARLDPAPALAVARLADAALARIRPAQAAWTRAALAAGWSAQEPDLAYALAELGEAAAS